MTLERIPFDPERIRLTRLVDNREKMGYHEPGLACEQIERVYGPLSFPEKPAGRPLTYASYVMSIDGKIAFEDDETGPLIARTNHLDPDGALADFWVLNLLRAQCDGILIGAGTLVKEPDYSGSAYDPTLLEARLAAGKPAAPFTVIVTRSGRGIPFQNPVFSCPEVPVLVATSPEGYAALKKEIDRPHFLLNGDDQRPMQAVLAAHHGEIGVAVTGTGSEPDARELLSLLDAMGMERVLVESPAYCHHLMQEGMLDELFINTSALMVGGQATGIGSREPSFSSTDHPLAEVVTLHVHNASFLYTRYRMRYDKKG